MATVVIADIEYDKAAIMAIRNDMVTIRNSALENGAMEWAVTLSHTIGLLKIFADTLEEKS